MVIKVTECSVISTTTRASADTVGESLKTLITRMESIKAGATEDGVSLNNVDKVLKSMGMSLRDTSGNFIPLGNILDEIGKKWNTLDKFEQQQLSTAIAGTRQQTMFLALMQNYNNALEYQTEITKSAGLANSRYAIYLDSVEAAQNRVTASWEKLWSSFIESGTIKFFLNLTTSIFGMIDALGGIAPLLTAIIALFVIYNYQLSKNVELMAADNVNIFSKALLSLKESLQGVTLSMGLWSIAIGAAILAAEKVSAFIDMQNALLKDNETAWNDNARQMILSNKSSLEVLDNFKNKIIEVNKTVESAGWAGAFVKKQKIIENGLNATIIALAQSSKSYTEYTESVKKAADAAGYMVDKNGVLYSNSEDGIVNYTDRLKVASEQQYKIIKATNENSDALDQFTRNADRSYGMATIAGYNYEAVLGDIIGRTDDLNKITQSAANNGGVISFDDITELQKKFNNWIDLLKVENGQLKLNTDAVRDYNLAQIDDEIAIAKANNASEQQLKILQQLRDATAAATPVSRDFVETFNTMLGNVSEKLKGTESAEKFDKIGGAVANLNAEFKNGILSPKEYVTQLNDQIKNLDLSQTFGKNTEASQIFYTGLVMNATEALGQINSQWDAGKLNVVEYGKEMAGLGDMFVNIGNMALKFADSFGAAGNISEGVKNQITGSVGEISNAVSDLNKLQELNTLLTQGMGQMTAGNLQFASDAYNQYAMQVANAAIASGQSFTDMQGNALKSTESIYNYLTSADGNMKNFMQQSAQKTGQVVQSIVNGIGKLLQALAEIIKNFHASIKVTPQIPPGILATALQAMFSKATINLPDIGFDIKGDAGDLGSTISNILSGLGKDLGNLQINWDANIYTRGDTTGLDKIGAGFNNLNNNINNFNNGLKQNKDSIMSLLDMIIAKIKQEKEAEKAALKEKLDNYKKIIDKRKALIQSMQEEHDYREKLKDQEKAITDIQGQLESLKYDTSEEAAARRKELQDQLAKEQQKLDDMNRERRTKLETDALDKEYTKFEDLINKQIKVIDDYLSKPGQIMADAIKLVNEKSSKLYEDLINWNRIYGSGIDADVTKAWNDAYAVLEKYRNELGQIDVQHAIAIVLGVPDNIPLHHDGLEGGFIGGKPNLSSNEEFAKLMKGELVLNAGQMDEFMKTTLPTLQGTPDIKSLAGGGMNINKLVEINAHTIDQKSIPDVERIVNAAVEKLNKAMRDRGFLRDVNAYAI